MACRDGMYGYEEDMTMHWRMLLRNPAVLMLHLSFLVVLAGALCTWIFQQKGVVRLPQGESVVEFRSDEGKILPLPAEMELDSFRVEYYPGGLEPRDYVSYLKVDGKPCRISMNRILETDGYRFCQAGYDYDGSTILSVNHDPLGITLVYAGFVMFAVSGLWVLLSHGCRWRSLLRSLRQFPLAVFPGFLSIPAFLPVYVEVMSGWKRISEIIYDVIPFTSIIFILLFSGAILSFLTLSGNRLLRCFSDFSLWTATIFSAANFIFQWILSSHIPLSDSYGTLLFAVLITEMHLLLFRRQGYLLRGIAMTLAGAMALVAHLMEATTLDGNLMPVLNSPWLSIHVSLAMASYSLFGLTFVAATVAFISPSSKARMREISLSALYPAEWLLGLGIITGAVWANISWGSYWSWDPKETLALVTFIIYALPLHRGIPFLQRPRYFHIYMFLAILSVAATYFGVNLLPSLHSYN